MKNLYRWDAIKPSTKVYGVVANPVRHSMSPAIHNAAFDATGYDGIYLPLLVESSYESFKAFMETFVNFDGLDLSGLSITIPHKQNALRYLKEKGGAVEELAARIGAVNTIAIERSDDAVKLSGTNTDYAAILDSITDKLGIGREDLRGVPVAVLGAGGTARAAVAGLANCGAEVWITNRTAERAAELAREFDGHSGKVTAGSMEEIAKSGAKVWINTTSVGMYPNMDESPLGDSPKIDASSIVFDTVYNPIRTKLLWQAEQAGAKTINGVEMFVRQAAAQFETWTRSNAPREVMRRVVEQRLNEINPA
jgi:3-dehydroquinate dehydratase/shikimate dehydrogenase